MVEYKPGRITTAMPFVIFVISLALGFFLFFNRYPLYHDEIINTYKANTGLVFDYALRPVFYFMNYLFYHFLGSSPRSLTLGAVFIYTITATLLYLIGQRHFGLLGGFLCSCIFLFMPLVIHTGIRGMPHLPAGLSAVIILFFLSKIYKTSSEKKAGWHTFAIGIFGVISLATHPTMIGISFAILLWAVVGWVFKVRWFRIFYPAVLKNKHYALLLAAFLGAFALLNLLYVYFDGHTYVSLLTAGIGRTNNPAYSGYFQPWYWYLFALIKQFQIINISVLLFVVYYLIARLAQKSKSNLNSSENSFLFTVLFISLIFLASISLSKWKFERVLVTFVPLYALSAGFIISYIVAWFLKNKNTVIYSILAVFIILISCFWGIVNFYDYAVDVKKNIHNSKERYYGLYDQIHNVKSQNIGVIGNKAQQIFALRYITLAGKQHVRLADNLLIINNNEDRNAMINTFLTENIDCFMIPTGRKSTRDSISQDYFEAFNHLVSIGATRQYSWRGLYELWHYDVIPQSTDFYKYLAVAQPRARIGVYGSKNEVGKEFFRRIDYISGKFNLRIYPLLYNRRTAEQNMGFIERNNVSMILLPAQEVNGIEKDKLVEMKQHLKTSNWKHVDTTDHMKLELWVRDSSLK